MAMALSAGTRLGSYEIVSALGAGGMGEVYRARDGRLGRDVAIKLIPPIFADSPERVVRFEREAQILAALNHPHIAAIYGLEESSSGRYLVLEFVEGLSLAQHLEAAPRGLPVHEVLPMAQQVVEALEAAHEKGIVHRDLKPANIMVTPDGKVKVLDFGLARTMDVERPASAANSPTITFAATQAGIIMGTAAYMSPEQAKGRVADKRSDVWAFGCVLFEMLSGRRAFDGEHVSDIVAAILRGEPDWSALPADLPANVTNVLRRCLERDRKARIPDISVVRYLLAQPQDARPSVAAPAPARPRRGWLLLAGAAGVAGGLALAAGAWWWAASRRPAAESPQPMRFAIVPAAASAPLENPYEKTIALSPDGTQIVYVVRDEADTGSTRLLLRRFDPLDVTPLAGTEGGRAPFFSPDGRWVGFWAAGTMWKVPVAGGPRELLCRVKASPRGASWMADDRIVFATQDSTTGLQAVPAKGGEPVTLTRPQARADHVSPYAIPGRNEVLFTVISLGAPTPPQIALLDLATLEQRTLLNGGGQAVYVDTGHIVYSEGGSLRAVRYDAGARSIAGDPSTVEAGVMTMDQTGAGNFALSKQGHLLFVPGVEGSEPARRSLVWVNRDGRETPIRVEPGSYSFPRLSPDGTRVALEVRERSMDVWIVDVKRETPAKLTLDDAIDVTPIWTADGERVIFQSGRFGLPNLVWQRADGAGPAERLTTSPNQQVPNAVTRDGTRLVLVEVTPGSGPDLMLLRLDGKSKPEPLLQSPAQERNADLSPDDKWMVYQTNESGRNEVWVRPFPDVDSARWQIAASGERPRWIGGEIFYLDASAGAIMAAAVKTTPTFEASKPMKLFDYKYFSGPLPGREFDVAPDGKRLLVVKPQKAESTSSTEGMVVVLNWTQKLKD